MIIFLKTGGEVAYVSDENIHLGSDKANSLFVVAPYAPASSVCVAFKLPNGKTLGPGFVENQGSVIFDPEDGYAMQNVFEGDGHIPGYTFEGQNLSAWSYDIQSALTGVSGTLGIQLFIFADGRRISTNLINTTVNVGVNNLTLPSEPTEEGDVFHEIIRYLTESNTYMEGVKNDATASAEEARAWANGTYVDEEGKSQPVAEGTDQYEKNAAYYAEQAASSAASAKDYAEVTAPQKAEEAANTVLGTVNNRLNTLEAEMDSAEDRLGNAENRLDNVDYILEQFGAVKAQVDSSAALVKSIPARSDLFAYLNSVGGKTEKYNQLLNLPEGAGTGYYFWQLAEGSSFGQQLNEKITTVKNGVTIVNNGDGSFTINGTAEKYSTFALFSIYLLSSEDYAENYSFSIPVPNGSHYLSFGGVSLPAGAYVYVGTDFGTDEGGSGGDVYGTGGTLSISLGWHICVMDLNFEAGTVFSNLTIKPMLNLGTTPLPWQSPADPFTGLRSGKVTALKVYGANLLDVSKCVNKSFVDNGDGTYTIKGVGTDRFSEFAPLNIPANTKVYTSGKVIQSAPKSINIQFELADGSHPTIGGLDGTVAAKTYSSDIIGIRYYIQGTGTNADGVFGIFSDFWVSYANVGYFPYKSEPTVYAIPSAVQALDGYGDGFYTVYNQIRQNRITFDGVGAATYTKSCSRLILNGSENWRVSTSKANTFLLQWGITPEFCYTSEYEQFKSSDLLGTTNGAYMSNSSFAFITDTRYTTVEEFKAHLAEKPLVVLYSTTTPEITDISAELEGFDPVIPVEGGGRIEFVNEYNYDVPSTITYNIIQEA